MRITWLILLFFIPHLSLAAVTIHEVAWMGSTVSANDEWLELYNSSTEAVDVTGWILSDGMNLSIPLSGVINPGAYAVLERTSDESAAGTAFLIYTGALVNTGATLTLTRLDGGLEDQVAGGTDWQNIGGDNTTKETAQYTSGGWQTALPTPGNANKEATAPDTEDNDTEGETNTGSATTKKNSHTSASEPVLLTLPGVTLTLLIDAQTVAYVHQSVTFDVEPGGIGPHLIDSLVYEWNFGDGDSTGGKQVTHTFAFPGTYVVTVKGEYARQKQVARHEITVLPVGVSLTQNSTGDVQVNNDSPYEIDVSGYTIRGERSFIFPPRSVILPNQTITIARSRLGNTTERLIALYDTESALLHTWLPQRLRPTLTVEAAPSVSASAPYVSAASAPTITFPVNKKNDATRLAETVDSFRATTSPALAVPGAEATQLTAATAQSPVGQKWPYLGLIGLLTLAILALIVRVPRNEPV